MQPGSSTITRPYVTSAAEAAALDARTIAGGIESAELMRRAGSAAARMIQQECGDRLHGGVYVATGPGNNGGDGWIVAGLLARAGVPVHVAELVEARSADAIAARDAAGAHVQRTSEWSGESVVIDALLGTGSSGEPRGAIAAGVQELARAGAAGSTIVALDLPTGLDATSGTADSAVPADLTITFGSVKRGHLASRDKCGRIVVVDIGLVEPPGDDNLPVLVTAAAAYGWVPPIPVASHKGSRGGVSIIGGGAGMAGAAALAGHGALRAGAGSSRICVSDENAWVVHGLVPPALVTPWSKVLSDTRKYLGEWPEAIACGPGLGTEGDAPQLLDALLDTWAGPLVLDADALNLLVGRLDELRDKLAAKSSGCRAVLTPHPAEMKRLMADGTSTEEASDRRYDVALWLARKVGAVVLLKGVPTVIASPDGRRRVSAAGTAALATGGSGDVLTGMIGALLAQGVAPFDAAAAGAWFHGRAAELATGDRTPRGVTIEDVVRKLRHVWVPDGTRLPEGVLADLPALR
jgi:ADP-dependent NAD(P)H-hydrate dehydratase / NAD(P)H-hydrate epimerase